MKTVEIVNLRQREDRGGSIVVNYSYILTDELNRKKAGDGSVGIARSSTGPDQDVIIRNQVKAEIHRKIGFKGVEFLEPAAFKRGPGRPPNEPKVA